MNILEWNWGMLLLYYATSGNDVAGWGLKKAKKA